MKSTTRPVRSVILFVCCSGGGRLSIGFQRGAINRRGSTALIYPTTPNRRMMAAAAAAAASTDNSFPKSCTAFPPVVEFLQQMASWPLVPEDGLARLAIGNPAGDADSIISSIGSAYLDTVVRRKPTVPIISIPLDDLQSLRPETKYLLSLAEVSTDLGHSLFVAVDDPQGRLPAIASVTLVDHNQLTATENSKAWKVETILDHHVDEGFHTDTCHASSDERMVAFEASTSTALVASTCTLIVERWKKYTAPLSTKESDIVLSIPPSLSILLLGVILLDSINLSDKAGKATARDHQAVETINKETDWSSLRLPSEICVEGDRHGSPDLTKLFDTLQNQKFRPEFWNGLTASQALQLDYKSFSVQNSRDSSGTNLVATFGVSSVLQSMNGFLEKPNIWKSTIADGFFLPSVRFFGIMFMTVENDIPKRQMLLSCLNESLVQALVNYLEQEGSLQLQVVTMTKDSETGIHWVTMEQGNAKASRKQVVPILMDFLKREEETINNLASIK